MRLSYVCDMQDVTVDAMDKQGCCICKEVIAEKKGRVDGRSYIVTGT